MTDDADDASTLPGYPLVAAPGKLFLVGEYAVLAGGPAIVAAINRHATAQYASSFPDTSPLVAEAQRRAFRALGERGSAIPPGAVLVESRPFMSGDVKLGLGSSAAVAVATVGAVLEAAGVPIHGNRDLLFEVADAAHRAAQGGLGSGADVAASTYGGLVRFVRPPDGAASTARLAPLAGLGVVAFWTREPAPTPGMLRAVDDFARREPAAHERLMTALAADAERFAVAIEAGKAKDAVKAADRYARGLAELGKAARVGIVSPRLERAAALARSLGGTAKPSGAGGGDVGVAFFVDARARGEFASRCSGEVSVLDVGLDPEGARRRVAPSMEKERAHGQRS